MNLLRYEFIDGPDGSINGMLRTLVKELRYNSAHVTIQQFKEAMPRLHAIELKLQNLDAEIKLPKRNYVSEIMEELNQENENETNIIEDLQRASNAMFNSFVGHQINFEEFSYSTGRAEHYHWIEFLGYADKRPVDAGLILVREAFRAISYKYQYIFLDLS